jgi:hypothetical protein
MKTHIVIIDFARQYGIKEGLILTELCRRAYISETQIMPFSVTIGKDFFPYMSVKQIRLSLQNLRAAGCIEIYSEMKMSFDRTRQYRINDIVFQNYIQAMLFQQLSIQEACLAGQGKY